MAVLLWPLHYTESFITFSEEVNSAVSFVWKLGVIIPFQDSSSQSLVLTRLFWVSHITWPGCCVYNARRRAYISCQWLKSLWHSYPYFSFLAHLAYLMKDLLCMDCQQGWSDLLLLLAELVLLDLPSGLMLCPSPLCQIQHFSDSSLSQFYSLIWDKNTREDFICMHGYILTSF